MCRPSPSSGSKHYLESESESEDYSSEGDYPDVPEFTVKKDRILLDGKLINLLLIKPFESMGLTL